MLSRSDYIAFKRAVRDILKECLRGVNPETKPQNASMVGDGFTKLTKDNRYYFSEEAKDCEEQLIEIINRLPVYPTLHLYSCATIAYADLLPDDMSTKRELLKACELADEFFSLLEINKLGIVDKSFISKYGFKMFAIDSDYKDVIKPNRSAFVQEDAELDLD